LAGRLFSARDDSGAVGRKVGASRSTRAGSVLSPLTKTYWLMVRTLYPQAVAVNGFQGPELRCWPLNITRHLCLSSP